MKLINTFTGEIFEGNFQTTFNTALEKQQEHPDPKSQTETAYIPPTIQINDMIEAGKMLDASRRARFDSIELSADDDNIPLDPAREPGADIVDVMKASAAPLAAIKKASDDAQAALRKDEEDQLKLKFDIEVEKAVNERLSKSKENPDKTP